MNTTTFKDALKKRFTKTKIKEGPFPIHDEQRYSEIIKNLDEQLAEMRKTQEQLSANISSSR